jgi:hypothetical protein
MLALRFRRVVHGLAVDAIASIAWPLTTTQAPAQSAARRETPPFLQNGLVWGRVSCLPDHQANVISASQMPPDDPQISLLRSSRILLLRPLRDWKKQFILKNEEWPGFEARLLSPDGSARVVDAPTASCG